MSKVKRLIRSYGRYIAVPWRKDVAPAQRVVFCVYPENEELRLRARIDEFEIETKQAGHNWAVFDLSDTFPRWLASQRYAKSYFQQPHLLPTLLPKYRAYITKEFAAFLESNVVGEQSVGLGRAAGNTARDTHHAPLGILLHHLSQEQPFLQHQPRATSPASAHRMAEHAPEGRDVAGQSIHANENGQAAGAGAHHLHEAGDQRQITVHADRPTQPQPRRHGHRHGHPDPFADHLHPEFVSLDVLQVYLPLLDDMLVNPLAMLAGPRLPISNGTFVKTEGGDNRLRWTAMTEQREHNDEEVEGLVQSVERRAFGSDESLIADPTLIALLLPAEHLDIALPDLPSGRAIRVVAELGMRVHR